VSLSDVNVTRQSPAGHQQYQPDNVSGRLKSEFVARTPVHVSSGLLTLSQDRTYPVVKEHFRTKGQLAIPATSLRGCIRSILEAISSSAISITQARGLPRKYRPFESVQELDVAQRIFGVSGYMGMVRFSDALLCEGQAKVITVPPLYRPRSESINTYFKGLQPRGRKFYMHGQPASGMLPLEVCDVASRFTFTIDFDNLTPGELGLLLIALGLGQPKLWPKLGGSKPACLGTIEMVAPYLEVLDVMQMYMDFASTPTVQDIQAFVEAASREQLVLPRQLKELAEILHWPRDDRDCPDSTY
jgi:CRISPR/Cas system CSM-associated protein Csm3 (group 7 of RAMP superfamily)